MTTMKFDLTDVRKPQGWAPEFIALTCLDIPYRIPPDIDGKPTVKKEAS